VSTASPDVELISTDGLPERQFPADDFRIVVKKGAYKVIHTHVATDRDNELCGVLLGEALKDKRGPYLMISAAIPGEHAESQAGQVMFTHETWNHIHKVKDAEYPSLRIVGWYHTHPGFGVFLSPQDEFIHKSFFNEHWQVAFVVDPKSEDEGFLVWREGKPDLVEEFWVGRRRHARSEDLERLRRLAEQAFAQSQRKPRFRLWLTLLVSAVITGLAVLLFLAGLQGRFRNIDLRIIGLSATIPRMPLDSIMAVLQADSSLAGADVRLRQEGNTLVCEGQVYTKYQGERVEKLLRSAASMPYSIRLAKVPMYQVKEGDYLERIARRLYGDADKWEYIRYENSERITNKDSIEPGWMLIVPAEVP
jgi:proteasome lid subunit RPN8/RPN11/nucleoid-associated protein YgaU